MIKIRLQRALLFSAAALLASCATSVPTSSRQEPPISEIAGIRLEMPRDAVRRTLAATARLEREERHRQEVWTLANDPRFASLIIGYTPDWDVRFVTAVARPEGLAVHYDEVLDVASAGHHAAGRTHTYTWKAGTPPYSVIAIGPAERIEYLSLKREPRAPDHQEDD